MPRRPRPANRPQKSNQTGLQHDQARHSKAQLAKQARPKAIDFLSEPRGPERVQDIRSTIEDVRKASDEESEESGSEIDEEEDDVDVDAPRVAQWVDDDEFEEEEQVNVSANSGSEESDEEQESENEAGPSRRLRSLQDDLSTLPLGTLRNAQRSLAQARALGDSDSDSEESSGGAFSASEDDRPSGLVRGEAKEKLDWSSKPKKDVAKRTNKHAPVEVTSKRPVSRRRVVVEDKLPKPRDPRFTHAVGQYDASKFKQQYGFLSSMHSVELKTLREHLKRARKLLVNSPSDLRTEREAEVERLELAMKRAESAVNQDKREQVEFKTLQSVKGEEKEKRKKGKAGWWMKRSEQKELLDKARLDAIASVGGKRAVKKAIEKKQKKISQKEKRSRPFPRNEDAASSAGKRRRPAGPVETGRAGKRRKVV